MTDMGQKEFVLWYLESQGYNKTLEEVKKSLKPEKIINRKKRRKFKKIKNEIQSEPAPKEKLLVLYYQVLFYSNLSVKLIT